MLSFGLVNIPVKVYSATDSSAQVTFRQLHAKCKNTMNTQHYCGECQQVVPKEDQLKATQVGGANWVVFTADELKAASHVVNPVIDLREFVTLVSVDPVLFERAHYLVPDKVGVRGYWLLNKALMKLNYCGLGHYASRGKDHLALVRPTKHGLVLQVLRFHAEIHPFSDIDMPDAAPIKRKELELAVQLIESRVSIFNAARHKDPVQTALQNVIAKKVTAGDVVSSAAHPVPSQPPTDLTEVLKASLKDERE